MKKDDFSKAVRHHGTVILAVVLGVLLVGTAAYAVNQNGKLKTANDRMNAVVQKAFYEICELTEGMAVNFSKLPVTAEVGYMQALLNEIARQTQGTLSNLALLPLGEEHVSATIKFINQAGDFAGELSQKLAKGGGVTQADYEMINTLSNQSATFSAGMGKLLNRYESGEAVFTHEDYGPSGDESLYPLSHPASEYPTLLYDGPFSDGRRDGEYKFLRGLSDISEARAREMLTGALGLSSEDRIDFVGQSDIPVACYEYTVQQGDYLLEVGMTRSGGELLYILSDHNVTQSNLTEFQAVEAARNFLRDRGYGDMEESYSSLYEGILTVNFAPVEQDVVLYPDLIKVQVSMQDGTIIGLEPVSYLMNHVARSIETPQITPEAAMDRLSSALTAQHIRLCLIPEEQGEYLCYEIDGTDRQNRYLVYIDAMTGAERKIMQVIEDDHGTLVM